MIKKLPVMLLGLILLASAGFADVMLTGAGATFPYPIYSKWFHEYNKQNPDIKINYQSIGSGGGVRQIIAGTVDFGASDAPMTKSEMNSADSPILHIPTVIGPVAVAYNLKGIGELKLNSDVLAEIFLGKINKWDDEKIEALNPGVKLPGKEIMVVHRSDGSGTTNIFTDYLAKVNTQWATQVGVGKSVTWPVGIGAKGNEGVSGAVKQNDGAISYTELSYVELNHLSSVALKNKSGKFVKPSLDATSAAASGAIAKIPADYRVSITNAAGAKSYPISGFTWLLVHKDQKDPEKGKALADFLKWSMSQKAQGLAQTLSYAPLPDVLTAKVLRTINTIKY
ncbi:phosphate ABC transporter substrate-binding protein PstS [Candidatus Saganbacteria bacterium]|nr:phosphate ABC transporter substrate-binding protein PstS [Candidatus Saganbacteria bacterium]